MKKLFSYLMIFACLLGTAVVTSCGSDDDKEVTLETPKYESDAALYRIETNDAKIAYIELTSAGNYYIEYLTMVKGKAASLNVNEVQVPLPFASSRLATRASIDNFEYGTFKKNEDGSYELEGKGTLTIETAGGSKYTITITINGKEKKYTGTREPKIYNTATVSKICRSWRMKKVYINWDVKVMGITNHISEEASSYKDLMNKLNKYTGSNYKESIEEIDYITFNTSGSYVVKTASSIERSYWKWNESKSTLYLSNDSNIGLVVSFSGKRMKMDYTMDADMKGEKGEEASTSVSLGYEFEETLVR